MTISRSSPQWGAAVSSESALATQGMSEEEIREIMGQFNEIINISTSEVDSMKRSLREAKEKQEQTRKEYLQLEMKHSKLKQEHSLALAKCAALERQNQNLQSHAQAREQAVATLQTQIAKQEEKFANQQEARSSEDRAKFAEEKVKGLLKEVGELRTQVGQLRQEKVGLEVVSRKLSTPHQCKHCQKYFLPLQNGKQSCEFHPGKLKFFSCKGCGGDQYMSCCNFCKQCRAGCRRGEHVFS